MEVTSSYDAIAARLESLVFQTVPFFKRHNIENSVLIFSDPRGGSSWVAELVHEISRQPIIWEPLHIDKFSLFRDLGFGWRQFIPEHAEWPEAKKAFALLFQGRALNDWTCSQTSVVELLRSKYLIFKFCRGNQLLPWLTRNFTLQRKPLYMVRHPFAVVASQLKHGGWSGKFTGMNLSDGMFSEQYRIHEKYLRNLGSREEALTAMWCLTNLVPLRHPENTQRWVTLTYEELVLNPESSLTRILTSWNIDFDVDTLNFRKPSRSSRSQSPVTAHQQITQWTRVLSDDQVSKMNNVLNYFGVTEYGQSPYPEFILGLKEPLK